SVTHYPSASRNRDCYPTRRSSDLNVAELDKFLAEQVARAKAEGVLFSVHLKATMMMVSDPILFGRVVRAYFSALFEAYGEQLDRSEERTSELQSRFDIVCRLLLEK